MLKTLAAKEGFDLQLFPNPLPGNDQAAVWTQIRRFNPDWIISWNLSSMHVVAVARDEAQRHPDGEARSSSTGSTRSTSPTSAPAEAKGIKRGTNVVGGTEPPADAADHHGPVRQGQGQRRPQEPGRRLLQHRPGDVLGRCFEGTRLAIKQGGWPLTPAEDQGRPGEPEGLRRQRPDRAGDGDRARITAAAARPASTCGTARSGCRRPTGSPRSTTWSGAS